MNGKWTSSSSARNPEAWRDLAARIADIAPDTWSAAVDREVRCRSDRFLTGVERYRRHPYHRDLADPPVFWREARTRVLDYGPDGGIPLLVVPSLINRGYVLDLSGHRSFLRWLVRQGIRPLLVDWGPPSDIERGFDLTDYIAGRLERALGAIVDGTGRAVPVLGYCMGGLLATALAMRRPREIGGLVLMATPWDFHADGADKAKRLAAVYMAWQAWTDQIGMLPIDAIQALFAAVDPLSAVKKFSRFAAMDPDGPDAEAFVALEDWLNDGVPLAAPVAKTCLLDWYGRNTPAAGEWRIAGQPVDPKRLDLPSLHLIPARDRIVPPASARALAASMAGADIVEPPLGHIGMVVSGTAKPQVWTVIADWLARLPARQVNPAL